MDDVLECPKCSKFALVFEYDFMFSKSAYKCLACGAVFRTENCPHCEKPIPADKVMK